MTWSRPGVAGTGMKSGVADAVSRANGRLPTPARRPERARILVVAAVSVAAPIARTLGEAGYEVALASRTMPARDVILDGGTYDLIVLDAGLPAAQGFAMLETLRAWGAPTPVLLATSGGDVADTIRGLDLGADDVAARRCSPDELRARVGALLRRRVRPSPVLRVGDLELDPGRRHVARGGRAIVLSGRQYALLEYLMRNHGRVLTRTTILDHVWGSGVDHDSNLVEVYISYLRRKVDGGRRPRLLHTVRGVGYMLSEDG
jgi:DNA-binding response OmpR family regulator